VTNRQTERHMDANYNMNLSCFKESEKNTVILDEFSSSVCGFWCSTAVL